MSLDKELQGLELLKNQSQGKRKEVEKANSDIDLKFQEIRKKILDGHSTGDKITDFVLFYYGETSTEKEAPYRKLQEKLSQKKPFEILLEIERHRRIEGNPFFEKRYLHSCMPPPDHSYRETQKELHFGILVSDMDFDFNRRRIIFPTKNYAHATYRFNEDFGDDPRINKFGLIKSPLELSWNLIESHIEINPGHISEFSRDLLHSLKEGTLEDGLLEIFEGPFILDMIHLEGHSRLLSAKLNLYTKNQVQEYFNNNAAVSYVGALNLLGLKAPERFQSKYDQRLEQERSGVLKKLDDLIIKEQSLEMEIKSIEEQIRFKGDIYVEGEPQDGEPGYTYTVAQQIRDKTHDQKKFLEHIYKEIKSRVEEALELELDKTDMVLQQRPGVKINVREYISGLAQKYEVTIPAQKS